MHIYMRDFADMVRGARRAIGAGMTYSYNELIDYICTSGFFTDSELENVMAKTARRIYKIAD